MPSISRPLTLTTALATLALAGCGSSAPPATTPPAPSAAAPIAVPAASVSVKVVNVPLASVGLDASAIDKKVDPCQDFYQYACGGWLARTEIPADKSKWARSFSEIYERNEAELHQILEEASHKKSDDAATTKIGDFYGACMDEAAIEKAGAKPIAGLLAKAKKVSSAKALSAFVTELHQRKIWALFDVSSSQDFQDATKVIANLDQNGLGLPDRDYYVKDDDKSKDLRGKYQEHVERMMKLAGFPAKEAKQAALDVMSLETDLAKASKTRVERRDPKGLYNKLDRDGVAKVAPKLEWDAYWKALGYADMKDVNVTAPKFFEEVSKLFDETKPAVWQHYLAWTIVRSAAPSLSKAFVDEKFAMEKALTGQPELPVRWKRCVSATDGALGELLAQPFIARKFAGDSKAAAEQMVHEVSAAFGRELAGLDWMDAKTKERAAAKLQKMAYLIGYPSKWRKYEFAVDPKSYASNVLAAREWDLKRDLAKIGKPVDREEWQMSPPTVNAYYDPQLNHMVFPAGILQPPFYSTKASIAVNLGGMGMVVGHELTHGFDDEGSQFTGEGNLSNWWEPESGDRFKSKTGCVSDQYGEYESIPGVKLNGKLTLGENVADGGGAMLAFRAYRHMRQDAGEVTVADGYSEDQQFFLAVGQAWCSKYRDEYARMAAQVDPHSPPKFRVNGTLADVPEFAQAFSCGEGTPMHPAKACKIW